MRYKSVDGDGGGRKEDVGSVECREGEKFGRRNERMWWKCSRRRRKRNSSIRSLWKGRRRSRS